jgi:hypothetical protein
MTKIFINRNLKTDFTGKIQILDKDDLEGKQDLIGLYIDIVQNEIPFSDFGNKLIVSMFDINDEVLSKSIVSKLINDIEKKYKISVVKSNAVIADRKLSLQLFLSNDMILEII